MASAVLPVPATVRSTEPPPEEPREEGAEGMSAAALFGALPAWLLSAIFHIIVILLLALCTYSIAVPSRPDEMTVSFDPPEQPLEVVETQTVAIDATDIVAPSNDAAGMAALGELPRAELAEVGDRAAAEVAPDQIELGQLFGRDGAGMATVGLGPGAGAGAEFFGVKAKGKSFIFVVDASNSMKRGKFDAAKRELMAAIKRLKPEQSFYVVFFNHAAHRMFDDKDPELRPIRASPTNIGKLERWMSGVELALGTSPLEAVQFALSRHPDAIYILSDGKFTDRGRTVDWLKEHNIIDDPVAGYGPKVVIHTLGFYSRDGEETLAEIAKRYRGTYRFVPKGE